MNDKDRTTLPMPDPDMRDDDAPLENVVVGAEAEPRDSEDEHEEAASRDTAKKVAGKLKEAVEKAVKKAAPAGKSGQIKAAKNTVDDAARQINPRHVKSIKATVSGKDGSGRRIGRSFEKRVTGEKPAKPTEDKPSKK